MHMWYLHLTLIQTVHRALLTGAALESRLRHVHAIRTSLKRNPDVYAIALSLDST
jgi:hypothetical protein